MSSSPLSVGAGVCLLLLLLVLWPCAAHAKKVHIPDELDDVVDDEEDEQWKAWGKPKPKPPPPFDPPPDLSNLQPSQIQEEMLKRQYGTSMGFVKLRLDVRRNKDDIVLIAKKWTKLLRTGSISAKIMAVDVNTIMFILEDGQETAEVKDFILSQPEAYEFKLGEQAYRRPGDPPLEVVVEKLRGEAESTKVQRDGAKEEL